MAFNVRIDKEKFDHAMQAAPGLLKDSLQKSMAQAMEHIRGNAVRNVSGPYLKVRSGRLRSSIFSGVNLNTTEHLQGFVKVGGDNPVGSPVKYAGIQEYGGTITPTASKYLTIPIPEFVLRAGHSEAKFTAKEVISNPSTYGFDGTFFAKSKAGNLLLFGKKSGKAVPLFVLKSSVTIKAKYFFKDAFERSVAKAEEIFFGNVNRTLERVFS